jgi:hypothetical protein
MYLVGSRWCTREFFRRCAGQRNEGGHGDRIWRGRRGSIHCSSQICLFAVVLVVNSGGGVADGPFGCRFLAVKMTANVLLESERLEAFCKLLRVEASVMFALDAVASEGFKWCLRTGQKMTALGFDDARERLHKSVLSLPFIQFFHSLALGHTYSMHYVMGASKLVVPGVGSRQFMFRCRCRRRLRWCRCTRRTHSSWLYYCRCRCHYCRCCSCCYWFGGERRLRAWGTIARDYG